MDHATIGQLRELANHDAEFGLTARHWTTTLRLDMGAESYLLNIHDGQLTEITQWRPTHQLWTSWQVTIAAPAADWQQFLAPLPQPFYQDLWGAVIHHGFTLEGDLETLYPYYPALRRLFDLMRTLSTPVTTHAIET